MQNLGLGAAAEAPSSSRPANETPDRVSSREEDAGKTAPPFVLINQRSGLYMASRKIQSGLEHKGSPSPAVPAAGTPRPDPGAKVHPREYYEKLADEAASRHGLDPHLVRAVISTESSFNPGLISRAGAVGLMQLMPGTASDMKVKDAFDPAQNIEGGTKYLAWLSRKFAGDENKILAAYNWGPGNVAKGGRMPLETRNYLQRVKNFRESYRQASLTGQKSPLPNQPRTSEPSLAAASLPPQTENSAG
jgi:soluble lytic murein transglycosylase-like protein